MLDEKELRQVRDYVIEILPELLREDPEIATTIEGILAQHFPRRDDFSRLLDELQLLREQTDRRLEQMERRLEQMERRLDQMDQRLEQMDQRLDQMERRLEQMDQRLDQMERRLEQMDQRLDQMERRIEQVEKQIALLREEIALLREEMDRRFEETNRVLLEVRRDVAKLQHGQEMILERMDGQEAWLRFVTGNLRDEKGKTLEDMFAAALRYGLKNPDITPKQIRLRQKLVDEEGRVFKPGFETEVDLIAENNKLTVFEVKATAKRSDVDIFALKTELVAAQNPDKSVRGVFISLAAPPAVRERCADYGLELVD